VAVTAGAIRRAKLQYKCHHQQTNTQHFFNSPDALPVAQPTVSEHLKERFRGVYMLVVLVCVCAMRGG